MCSAEKINDKLRGSNLTKKQLQRDFATARNDFDKNPGKNERAYRKGKMNEIDSINCRNPKELWNRVNNLLLGQRKQLPDRVKGGGGGCH